MEIATKRVKSISEKCIAPKDYIVINVFSWHKKDTEYYDLCPYELRTDGNEEQYNEGGIIFENFWQGSKVYPIVYPIEVYPHYSFKGKEKYLIWKYDKEEVHLDENNNIKEEYWNWRDSIFKCKKAIRYPNSYHKRSTCKFVLHVDDNKIMQRMDYITARKELYIKEYIRLIRLKDSYKKILNHVKNGKKICIFEIDVPNDFFITSLENLNILMEDKSKPFGHGLCLAKALHEDFMVL